MRNYAVVSSKVINGVGLRIDSAGYTDVLSNGTPSAAPHGVVH